MTFAVILLTWRKRPNKPHYVLDSNYAAPPLATCPRCGAVGTAVDMGVCCRVAEMNFEAQAGERFRPLPRLGRQGRQA